MKCNEVKEFLRTGEEPLDEHRRHLDECATCSEAFRRESELSRLIRAVPQAEPPANFDSVLREKIESCRSRGSAVSWLSPSVLIPAAAGAVILLVVGFAFNSLFFSGNDSRAENEAAPKPIQTEELPGDIANTVSDIPQPDDLAQVEENRPGGPAINDSTQLGSNTRPSVRNEDDSPGGGSIDFGARPADPTNPDWVGPPRTDPSGPPSREFSPAEILSELGIETRFSESRWKVVSVRPGSIGARTGVKQGDVIKAIDGRILGQSVDSSMAAGRRMTIIRNGREMTVAIRP